MKGCTVTEEAQKEPSLEKFVYSVQPLVKVEGFSKTILKALFLRSALPKDIHSDCLIFPICRQSEWAIE